jgi:hypothetical protein
MTCEPLTPKEVQVAILVWEGLTNHEIGKIVGTTEQLIKNHCAARSTDSASGAGWNWPGTSPARAERTGPLQLLPAKSPATFSEPTKRLGFEIAGC